MTWTDEQLIIIIDAASHAEGGTYSLISEVLKAFIDRTSFALLDRFEALFEHCEISDDATWDDIAPQWHIWESPRPNDAKYLYGQPSL